MGADIELDEDVPWLTGGRVLFEDRQLRFVIDKEQNPKRRAESCELRKNAGIDGETIEALDWLADSPQANLTLRTVALPRQEYPRPQGEANP